jgi:hypothetical protein
MNRQHDDELMLSSEESPRGGMTGADWPAEDVLRSILELPGIAGTTRHDIERFLADPAAWRNARSGESRSLLLSLHSAVLGHWGQLCDRRAI